MGSINGGYYFNVMYLTFSGKKKLRSEIGLQSTRKIEDIKIEGPIPVCEKIFKNLNRCNYVPPEDLPKAGPLVNWAFHKKEVYADPTVNTIYQQEWVPKMQPYLVQLVES